VAFRGKGMSRGRLYLVGLDLETASYGVMQRGHGKKSGSE
jgi:hypothetical protein